MTVAVAASAANATIAIVAVAAVKARRSGILSTAIPMVEAMLVMGLVVMLKILITSLAVIANIIFAIIGRVEPQPLHLLHLLALLFSCCLQRLL